MYEQALLIFTSIHQELNLVLSKMVGTHKM